MARTVGGGSPLPVAGVSRHGASVEGAVRGWDPPTYSITFQPCRVSPAAMGAKAALGLAWKRFGS